MIFIDRSVPESVAEALKKVRDDLVWLEDRLPHDVTDQIWLARVGSEGWLGITRDKKILTRPAERRAILLHQVGCFCLTQKQASTRWQYLKLLVNTLDEMERLFASTQRPFIYSVGRTGQFRRVG